MTELERLELVLRRVHANLIPVASSGGLYILTQIISELKRENERENHTDNR
jgi:hypothetical protein